MGVEMAKFYKPKMKIPRRKKAHLIEDNLAICANDSLSKLEIKVALYILTRSTKDGYIFEKLSTITTGVGKKVGDKKDGPDGKRHRRDEPDVSKAIKSLKEKDIIRVEKGERGFSFYALGHALVKAVKPNKAVEQNSNFLLTAQKTGRGESSILPQPIEDTILIEHDNCQQNDQCVEISQPTVGYFPTINGGDSPHISSPNISESQDNNISQSHNSEVLYGSLYTLSVDIRGELTEMFGGDISAKSNWERYRILPEATIREAMNRVRDIKYIAPKSRKFYEILNGIISEEEKIDATCAPHSSLLNPTDSRVEQPSIMVH
jgi:hypothetical protein